MPVGFIGLSSLFRNVIFSGPLWILKCDGNGGIQTTNTFCDLLIIMTLPLSVFFGLNKISLLSQSIFNSKLNSKLNSVCHLFMKRLNIIN